MYTPYPGAKAPENSRTDVPYTCACRMERATLYVRLRISVALLNLACWNITNPVISRMIADTTISSTSVNPAPKGFWCWINLSEKERRKCLKEINMQKVSAGRPEDKKRGKGHLALHCNPRRNEHEQNSHNGSCPKRQHKSGEARG